MINRNNPFKQAIQTLNQGTGAVTPNENGDLSAEQKKQLVKQTQMYIQLEEIVADLSQDLNPGEEIAGYLPFTNEENSAAATVGIMGMTYVTSFKAQKYRNTFHDLRGNRMLIFTNQRMIFTIIIEFLEERRYYSYPYNHIKGIRFEKHPIGYFDWQKGKLLPKRKKTYWYTLDFQSQSNIFTEVLQPKEVRKFQDLVEAVPALKAITIDENMHRDTRFDYLFSNTKVGLQGMTLFFILVLVVFVGLIIYQLATGRGSWGEWLNDMRRLNTSFIFHSILTTYYQYV